MHQLHPRRPPLAQPIFLLIVLAGGRGQLALAQADAGGLGRLVQTWEDQPDWVTALAFLKDGKHLCVGTYEELELRDARSADPPRSLALPPGYARSLAVSPDGKLIAAGH